MKNLTPQQFAQKWAANLTGATQAITQGVQGVQVAPGQAAAAQVAAYQQNVAANVGKWQQNVAAVPLAAWQQSMIKKGIPNLATGTANAQNKVAQFAGQLMAKLQQVVPNLPPRGTKAQNRARLNAYLDAMSTPIKNA